MSAPHKWSSTTGLWTSNGHAVGSSLADPTGRHNLPGPFESVADKVGSSHREVVGLLREATRVVDSRLSHGGLKDPTPERQGILIAVENGHQLFADDFDATRLAEHIAVDGGPASVAMVVTAPDADIAHYGGSKHLRSALARRNCFAMGPNGRHMLKTLGKVG